MERESIRQLFSCTIQPAPLCIALHVILAPHSLTVIIQEPVLLEHKRGFSMTKGWKLIFAGGLVWGNCKLVWKVWILFGKGEGRL